LESGTLRIPTHPLLSLSNPDTYEKRRVQKETAREGILGTVRERVVETAREGVLETRDGFEVWDFADSKTSPSLPFET